MLAPQAPRLDRRLGGLEYFTLGFGTMGVLRGLRGLRLCAADVVEVAPAYDHAEITAMAASHVAYELVSLLAVPLDHSA